jgi:selenide,water dikinase
MGAKPIFALAVVGMPLEKIPLSVIGRILAGGESVCAEAGIPIAGGHSIDVLEPIYGLVALGLVHPDKVKKNSSAKPGDVLILGKPLGVGILSAALKKGQLSDAGYRAMLDATTRLNIPGAALAEMPAVHAMTDVTGFGFAGHLLEICRGSKLAAEVSFSELPLISDAVSFVKDGIATGASDRNWKGYGKDIAMPAGAPEWQKKLVTDPQTSGGLLVACAPEAEAAVLAEFSKHGFAQASRVGRLAAGPARVTFS